MRVAGVGAVVGGPGEAEADGDGAAVAGLEFARHRAAQALGDHGEVGVDAIGKHDEYSSPP